MKCLKILNVFLIAVIFLGLHARYIEMLPCTFHEPFKITSYQKREHFERRIVFLEDNAGQKYVLKCYDNDHKEEALCEYLGSFIGASVGIPVNKVNIVMGGSLLAEIDNGTSLATLHTFVPGKELCKWFEIAPRGILLKGGLISDQHLNCLSLSDDLCDIMALDIFLNNKDRHHENCFYEEKHNRYYAIDMGDIFLSMRKILKVDRVVSDDMYQVILTLISREEIVALDTYHFLSSLDMPLSVSQKKALNRVNFILQDLIVLYPAEKILSMWVTIAMQVGYEYTEYKKRYLSLLLESNICWVQKVIEKINKLVNN